MGGRMNKERERKKKSPKTALYYIKKVLHFVTTVIMYTILLILILVGIVVALHFIDEKRNIDSGKNLPPLFNAYVIVSPSMVPTIKVEDAVIIKRVDKDELKKGDIITFNSTDYRYSGVTVTHRIVGIEKTKSGQVLYTTKGDNNNTPDSSRVSYDNIFGKVVLRIPKIGYIQYFLTQAYGWIIAVVVPCLAIIIYDIIKLLKTIKQSVVPKKKKKAKPRQEIEVLEIKDKERVRDKDREKDREKYQERYQERYSERYSERYQERSQEKDKRKRFR